FLAAVESAMTSSANVQPGDTVHGSDHGEIGTVNRVVEGTDDVEGYLLVPSGLIFKTDTYIPLDAVVKRSGTDIFINIPQLVIATMPWGEPPSRTERRACLEFMSL
ncbi:MAG: cysteine hydrolase, partial [Pyrinomonadaceae bacterium]